MLSILSPAKTLDFDTAPSTRRSTQPLFLDDAATLVGAARNMTPEDIQSLMGVSEKIAQLNHERFMNWAPDFSLDNAKQAVLAFKGDVYQGLDAGSMSESELHWAQDHLRILSGLYGILRPLDLMQAYRLEMGTKFATQRGDDLYSFWDGIITAELNNLLKGPDAVLLNLASNEYFKAVKQKNIHARIVTPIFMDYKTDKYKIISFFAKKARGLMSAFIVKNKITQVEDIKGFDAGGYAFNETMSEGDKWVFTRG